MNKLKNPFNNSPLPVVKHVVNNVGTTHSFHSTYATYFNVLGTREHCELMLNLSPAATKLYNIIMYKLINKSENIFTMSEAIVSKYMKRRSYYAAIRELRDNLFIVPNKGTSWYLNDKYLYKGSLVGSYMKDDNIKVVNTHYVNNDSFRNKPTKNINFNNSNT